MITRARNFKRLLIIFAFFFLLFKIFNVYYGLFFFWLFPFKVHYNIKLKTKKKTNIIGNGISINFITYRVIK